MPARLGCSRLQVIKLRSRRAAAALTVLSRAGGRVMLDLVYSRQGRIQRQAAGQLVQVCSEYASGAAFKPTAAAAGPLLPHSVAT